MKFISNLDDNSKINGYFLKNMTKKMQCNTLFYIVFIDRAKGKRAI